MSLCVTCAIRKTPAERATLEPQAPLSPDIKSELRDLHVFTSNSILALLAIPAVSGSKTFLPAVLGLLISSIGLRLAVNPCFIQNYPTASKCLHTLLLLVTICMAGVELVLDMKSLAIAVAILVMNVFLFIATVVYHDKRHEKTPLPTKTRVPPPTDLGSPGVVFDPTTIPV